MPHSPGLGAIYGIVAENGVPVEGAEVRLLDRSVPRFIRVDTTGEDGAFVFSGLNTATDDYMIFVTDDTSEGVEDPYKNALIQDRITPVPVHLGSQYPSSWVPKIKALNPLVLYPGPYLDTRFNKLAAAHAGCTELGAGPDSGGILDYSAAPVFPDTAFNLPVTELENSVCLLMPGSYGGSVGDNTVARFSMLAIADFAKPWGFTQLVQVSSSALTGSTYTNYRGISPIMVVAFDGTATIRVELCYLYTPGSVHLTDTLTSPFSVLKTYNTVLSAPPAGFEQIAVSVKNGSEVRLYVGEDEYLLDNTTVPSRFNGSSLGHTQTLFAQNAYFHSWNRVANSSDGSRMAMYAFTPYALTQATFLAIRDSLLTPQFPNQTGYAREVTVDAPSVFYMLDDRHPTTLSFLEQYVGNNSSLVPGTTYLAQNESLAVASGFTISTTTSPLPGRQACAFPGDRCLYNADGVGVPSRAFSFSGWFNQTSRAQEQYLVSTQKSLTDSTVNQFFASINTAGKLRLFLAGTSEDKVLDYVLPLDEWFHLALVVDKPAESVLLYVNGALAASTSVTSAAIYFDTLTSGPSLDSGRPTNARCLVVGGKLATSTTTLGFIGAMCGLALFNYPLPANRVEAQYSAKDVI